MSLVIEAPKLALSLVLFIRLKKKFCFLSPLSSSVQKYFNLKFIPKKLASIKTSLIASSIILFLRFFISSHFFNRENISFVPRVGVRVALCSGGVSGIVYTSSHCDTRRFRGRLDYSPAASGADIMGPGNSRKVCLFSLYLRRWRLTDSIVQRIFAAWVTRLTAVIQRHNFREVSKRFLAKLRKRLSLVLRKIKLYTFARKFQKQTSELKTDAFKIIVLAH